MEQFASHLRLAHSMEVGLDELFRLPHTLVLAASAAHNHNVRSKDEVGQAGRSAGPKLVFVCSGD